MKRKLLCCQTIPLIQKVLANHVDTRMQGQKLDYLQHYVISKDIERASACTSGFSENELDQLQ